MAKPKKKCKGKKGTELVHCKADYKPHLVYEYKWLDKVMAVIKSGKGKPVANHEIERKADISEYWAGEIIDDLTFLDLVNEGPRAGEFTAKK